MASSSSNSSQAELRKRLKKAVEVYTQYYKTEMAGAQGQSDQVNDDPVQKAELFLLRHSESKESAMKIFDESFKTVDDVETIQKYRNKLDQEIENAFQAKPLEDAVLQYTEEYESNMGLRKPWLSESANKVFEKAGTIPENEHTPVQVEDEILKFFRDHHEFKKIAMNSLDESFESDVEQPIKKAYKEKLKQKINKAFKRLIETQIGEFHFQLDYVFQKRFPTLDNPPDEKYWFKTFLREKRNYRQWGPVITGWEKFRGYLVQYGFAKQVQEKERELSKSYFHQQMTRTIARPSSAEARYWTSE